MIKRVIRQLRKINQKLYKFFFIKHKLDQYQLNILKKLDEEGIFIGKLSDLKNLNVDCSWLENSEEIINYLDKKEKTKEHESNIKGAYVVGMKQIPSHIMKNIYNFVLNQKFIEIFENYFELPLYYKGVDIRKDINDGKKIETRLWHLDSEDSKIIKILFYLEKVDTNTGPFTYIKKNVVDKKKVIKNNFNGTRIEDEKMITICEKKNMLEFTNADYNFAIVDTANVYHKGKIPERSRYSAFFCYNSKIPLEPSYCYNFQEVDNTIILNKYSDKVAKYKI
tara:strand:+ start:1845 stop:2684 length:840 start_codon:yes stop_codon:yes gene_type:complete